MRKYRLIRRFRYGTIGSWYEIHRRYPIIGWVRKDKFEGENARWRAHNAWESILLNGKIVKTFVEGEV